MTPEVLFTAALQLEAGWKVTECRFEPRQLLLKLDFEEGKRFGCPQCGKFCPTHDTKRWRHLNFFQYECLLEARVPRSNCLEHSVLSVAVPWGAAEPPEKRCLLQREVAEVTADHTASSIRLTRRIRMIYSDEALAKSKTHCQEVSAAV